VSGFRDETGLNLNGPFRARTIPKPPSLLARQSRLLTWSARMTFCGVPGDQNLKRIIFDLRREGTTDQETCFVIVRSRAQHQRRAMARMLVPAIVSGLLTDP
jgi:hypothetical protein